MPPFDFPAVKSGILKKDPSGENLSFSDDAQGSLSRLAKNVTSSGTSERMEEEQTSGQTLKSIGETLQYPTNSGDPAYQARVSFRMYSLQPNQPGADSKSHIKTLEDNIAPKGTNMYFANDADAAFGPATINSVLEGEDDEALEVTERAIATGNAKIQGSGIDGHSLAALSQGSTTKGGGGNTSLLSKIEEFSKDKLTAAKAFVLDNNFTKAAANVLQGGIKFQPAEGEPIVDMYFPLQMQFVDNAQYDGNAALGFSGAAATAAAEAGLGALGSTLAAVNAATNNVFDLFKGNNSLGEGAVRLASARLINAIGVLPGATGIKNALTLQNRVVVNPNIRALFRGVALREFTFNFKMIAESAQEAETVRKIVKHFRKQMYPDTLAANVGNGVSADLGFKFPNAFKITFKYRGSKNSKLPEIKYCYLRNVSHTINSTGGTFKRDGQASEIDLNLSFVEYKTLTKADIEKGF
tara:strand:+ start:537 stop:1940 length:1404 start_codon:yes stop_codon:yes gene_type:complete